MTAFTPRAPGGTLPDLLCDEVEALLPLVADGLLGDEQDPAVFAHLARCPVCQESLAQHDLVDVSLRAGTPASPTLRLRPRHVRMTWWTAAASLLIASGLGYGLWSLRTAAPAASAVAVAPVLIRVPATSSHPSYFVLEQDGRRIYIDPQELDKAPAGGETRPTVPVDYAHDPDQR
jgi:anti-sigma factor RsiW